ncbi:MAG: fibronectin type III domain-containing protein [Syntrophobacteraceae bacterium]|nr:fibronectin type III domain-containing protein [Syntrophobacteraceae bacterium]
MIGKAIATALIGILIAAPAFGFGAGGGGIGIGAPMETLMPGPPGNVTATAGEAMATVSFSPPKTNGIKPITVYTVTAYPGHVQAQGAKSPIVVTGLKSGETYTFRVSAHSAIGTGLASAPSNCVTPR